MIETSRNAYFTISEIENWSKEPKGYKIIHRVCYYDIIINMTLYKLTQHLYDYRILDVKRQKMFAKNLFLEKIVQNNLPFTE